jgi:hypothetical protein
MDTESEIEIELNSANGPKVVYPASASVEEIEAAVPGGWRVDWETTPADVLGGRKASPLAQVRS